MTTKNGPVRILYLDDNPADIKLITSIIQAAEKELPTTIDCVSTRVDYLAALRRCAHDVILCDHRMPGYSGDEALRDAQLVCPEVPFIMVTGELGEELAIETLKRGATDYVLKDRLARLVPSIKRALKEAAAERERRSISRSLAEAQRMAQVGSWEWNVQTGELHWSQELFSICGLDPNTPSLSLDVFARFVHPDDRDLVQQKTAQVIGTGVPVDFDFRIIRADGSVRVLHTMGEVREFDAGGKPRIIAGTNQDITERKQAEEALTRSQQHLEDMIRHAPTFIYEVDFRTQRFTKVNEAMCTFSGYTREELLAKEPMELLYEESQARFKERIAQWLKGEKPREDVEYHVRLREGDDRWVILKVAFIADEKGQPLGATVIGHDITERRRMEERLRESEEKFRALSESSPTAILVYRGTTPLYVNAAAVAMSGRTAEELLSMNLLEVIHPDDRPVIRDWALARTEGVKKSARYQARILTKSGEEKWTDVSSTFIQYEGKPAGIVSCVDITQNKHMEAVLRESEERFRTMANSAPIVIMVINERGETEMVNQAFIDLFGVAETEIRSLSDWPQLIHSEDSARALKLVRESINGQKPLGGEVRVRNAAGEWRWLLVRSRPRFSASGRFLGLVGCATDITEQKRMEKSLQRSAENLRLMVQGGTKPMMVVDRDGLIEAVSEAGEFLLGYAEGELVGRNIKDTIVPLSRMEAALQLEDLRKHAPRPLTATLRLLRKNGSSIWATAEVSLIVAGDGVTEKYLAKFEKLDVTGWPAT